MRYLISSLKLVIASQAIIGMCMVGLPVTDAYAKSGCCSKHHGVAGCDTASGFLKCKDNTTSPTCKCNGTTSTKPTKKTNTTTTTTTSPTTTTTTTPTSSTTETTVPAAGGAAATTGKTKGCCSRHGGVAKCDKASGYQMCKDGTRSTTCKCS